jgi:hypothetical protein
VLAALPVGGGEAAADILGRVGGFGSQGRPAGVAEGQGDVQGGAGSGPAVDLEVAAECFGPVLEPGQAGAVGEVRAAAVGGLAGRAG